MKDTQLKISGFGIPAVSGDLLGIVIADDVGEYRFFCPAERAELLREALIRAIESGIRDLSPNSSELPPIDVLRRE